MIFPLCFQGSDISTHRDLVPQLPTDRYYIYSDGNCSIFLVSAEDPRNAFQMDMADFKKIEKAMGV